MLMARSSKVETLWREHLKAARSWVRGSEVGGVDLDLLDANTCQCVLTYIDSGSLGEWKTATLAGYAQGAMSPWISNGRMES